MNRIAAQVVAFLTPKRLRDLAVDAAMLVGTVLVSYGAWLVYRPAGFIVGGLALVTGAVMFVRATRAPIDRT